MVHKLATNLSGKMLNTDFFVKIFAIAFKLNLAEDSCLDLERLAMEDLIAVETKDPACISLTHAFLYFKGFKSIQVFRMSHVLWKNDRKDLALIL